MQKYLPVDGINYIHIWYSCIEGFVTIMIAVYRENPPCVSVDAIPSLKFGGFSSATPSLSQTLLISTLCKMEMENYGWNSLLHSLSCSRNMWLLISHKKPCLVTGVTSWHMKCHAWLTYNFRWGYSLLCHSSSLDFLICLWIFSSGFSHLPLWLPGALTGSSKSSCVLVCHAGATKQITEHCIAPSIAVWLDL